MPAALAVPLILGATSAGTAVAGAKMASNASKNAAKTQSASADRALAAQQAGYQQQRQDFSPYAQQGAAAVGRLGQSAGTYTGGAPTPQTSRPPMGGMPIAPQGQSMGMASLGNPMGGPPPQQPGQNANIVWSGRQQPPQMGGQSGPGMPPQGGQIRVQAPTGEIAMLNPQQAQQAVQKGAKVLA